jgi:anthranilate synthase component 1
MVVRPHPEGGWKIQVQAGAGVVADSDPASEYQETLNKARAMLTALACLEDAKS